MFVVDIIFYQIVVNIFNEKEKNNIYTFFVTIKFPNFVFITFCEN